MQRRKPEKNWISYPASRQLATSIDQSAAMVSQRSAQGSQQIFKQEVITDKVGGSSAKPEVSKQSKEKRLKHKVSGYKSQSKRRSIAGCRLLLRTLDQGWNSSKPEFFQAFFSQMHKLYI